MPCLAPPALADPFETKDTLEQFKALRYKNLGRLLHLSFRQFTTLGQQLLHQHGFGDFKTGCYGLMANLEADGTTVVELAERLFYTKQAVSKMVKELEETGYLLSIPHPTDKRSQLVCISSRGVALMKAVIQEMSDYSQRFTQCLTKEEEDQLITLLGKLVEANMGALSPSHVLAVQSK